MFDVIRVWPRRDPESIVLVPQHKTPAWWNKLRTAHLPTIVVSIRNPARTRVESIRHFPPGISSTSGGRPFRFHFGLPFHALSAGPLRPPDSGLSGTRSRIDRRRSRSDPTSRRGFSCLPAFLFEMQHRSGPFRFADFGVRRLSYSYMLALLLVDSRDSSR